MAFDVAVIGLGAMGAATTFALTRRGKRVVALDPFPPGHEHGSSHGESRAIRLGYFEDPSYVPLVRAAYDAWRELERLTGQTVLTVTGVLEAGVPGSPIVAGSLAASQLHGLAHETLSGTAVNARFPEFNLPARWSAVYQPDGGFLRPELAIQLYVGLAEARGAEIRIGSRALAIESHGADLHIQTDRGPIACGSVVVAAGGWIADLVPELRPHLTLTRQVLAWFEPRRQRNFASSRFPVFILDGEDDTVYGFPDFAGTGVKIASHNPGAVLQHANAARQDMNEEDEARLRRSLAVLLPGANGRLRRGRACFYTRTPDEDFVVDHHPDDPRIVVASPCSGHGFKFASVLGEVLADLATDGRTKIDIGRFRMSRFEGLSAHSASTVGTGHASARKA